MLRPYRVGIMFKKAWNFLGLRGRIFLILTVLVLITLGGGSVMIWYTYRMESLFEVIINMDLAAFQTAQNLEIALANQKGYASYYFMDGNPKWLKRLEEQRANFNEQFPKAKKLATDDITKKILSQIEIEYSNYLKLKDHVIGLYQAGNREEALNQNENARAMFFKILNLCEQFKDIHKNRINSTLKLSQERARRLRVIALTAMSTAAVFGALLAFVLVSQILIPIRRLALEADRAGGLVDSGDEVAALKTHVRGLIADFGSTHDELKRSRERLFQSEKMALVGKLAAEVAHSIRNPMTSIKMRLFSLERTLDLTQTQREDFEVVSKEMRQLDNVVRNFLEFSRPPKLKKQKINISDIVDGVLQLLQKQLEFHNISVERNQRQFFPHIDADPELLKEVMVNLIVNACDAMSNGGKLTISEEDAVVEQLGRAILIKISDTGPGIPATIQNMVWEPFFSTKEDGTGLGLSIAMRIIEEHGGRIEIRSKEGEGATFIITLPVPEEAYEL